MSNEPSGTRRARVTFCDGLPLAIEAGLCHRSLVSICDWTATYGLSDTNRAKSCPGSLYWASQSSKEVGLGSGPERMTFGVALYRCAGSSSSNKEGCDIAFLHLVAENPLAYFFDRHATHTHVKTYIHPPLNLGGKHV